METMLKKPYAGRTAVVTGGADGIGRALAERFAALGMKVAVLDIRADAAAEAAHALLPLGAPATLAIGCDVADPAAMTAAAERIQAELGSIAIVWANAGVGTAGPFGEARWRNIEWVLSVNVLGVIHTARAFFPVLKTEREAGGPCLIGITASSASLHHPGPGLEIYGASKHATMGVAEGIRMEALAAGIDCTILCPGLTDTRIWDGARARPERFGGARHAEETAGERWRREGMSVEFVADATMAAIARGDTFCCPTTAQGIASFEARVAAIRQGFIEEDSPARTG